MWGVSEGKSRKLRAVERPLLSDTQLQASQHLILYWFILVNPHDNPMAEMEQVN